MITQEKIDRINFLARKSRTEALSSDEIAEQQKLRREYIDAYKKSLRNALENTTVIRPDGKREKLSEMKNEKK